MRARAHAVGHAVRGGRALAVRALPEPGERGHRPAGLDRRRPLDRGHRRGALVRLRHPPHHADGGLADHAGRHGLVLAEAVRLLRSQPGFGHMTALVLALALAAPSPQARLDTAKHRWYRLHARNYSYFVTPTCG